MAQLKACICKLSTEMIFFVEVGVASTGGQPATKYTIHDSREGFSVTIRDCNCLL